MDEISTHSGIENGDDRLLPWSIGFREAISISSTIHGWWAVGSLCGELMPGGSWKGGYRVVNGEGWGD